MILSLKVFGHEAREIDLPALPHAGDFISTTIEGDIHVSAVYFDEPTGTIEVLAVTCLVPDANFEVATS